MSLLRSTCAPISRLFALTFMLSACGGGGGGDDSASGSGTGELGTTEVTRSNGARLALAFSMQLYNTTDLPFLVRYLREEALSLVEAGEFDEETPCDSGSSRIFGEMSQDGTGRISIAYDNCFDDVGDVTFNGTFTIAIDQTDSAGNAHVYSVEYDGYQYRYDNRQTDVQINGSIAIRETDDQARATVNLQIEDNLKNEYVVSEDMQFTFSTDIYYSMIVPENLTGRVGHSRDGLVSLSTDSDDAAHVYLRGAGSSLMRIDLTDGPENAGMAIDRDGDSRYDAFLYASLFDLSDEDPEGNAQPEFSGLVALDGERGSMLELDFASRVYDNDMDFLDYTLSVIEGPSGSDPVTQVVEGRELRFQAGISGDYTLELTIADGRGGQLKVPLEVHIVRQPPQLETTDYRGDLAVGESLQIDVAPTNEVDGPYTYELLASPPGMTVSEDGQLSWSVAEDQFFFPGTEVEAVVEVANVDHSVEIPVTLSIDDGDRLPPLARSGIEVPDKANNIHVGDFDDDGNQEILLTDNRNRVYTLEWDGSRYVQDWLFPFDLSGGESIDNIAPLDEDSDGQYEIVVLADAKVHIIEEGLDKSRLLFDLEDMSSSDGELGEGYGLVVADINNNGGYEVVTLVSDENSYNRSSAFVVGYDDLQLLWSVEGIELGQDVDVGNVDGDAALEVVFPGGYVYDGATGVNQWLYSSDFGGVLAVGDVDGDSVDEVIAAQDGSNLAVFDVVARSMAYDVPDTAGCTVALAQLDVDSNLEILLAGCDWGDVTAFDATATGASERWSVGYEHYGLGSLAAGDADEDGNIEIIWGSGVSFSGGGVLEVFDNASQGFDFMNENPAQLDGPFVGGYQGGDGLGDQRLFFLVPRTDGGSQGSRLIALDGSTGDFDISDEIGSNRANHAGICVTDYDLDSVDEVIMSSADVLNGFFEVYDFFNDIEEWRREGGHREFSQIACGLINDDDKMDVAAIQDHSVALYDVYNQTLIWSSPAFTLNPRDVIVHDLDGDGVAEIVVQFSDRVQVLRKEGTSYVEGVSYALTDYDTPIDMLFENVDGAGQSELIVLLEQDWFSSEGEAELVVLDSSMSEVRRVSVAGRVTAMASTGNRDGSLLVGVSMLVDEGAYYPYTDAFENRVKLIDLDNGRAVWQSPALIGRIHENGLRVIDGADGRYLGIGTDDAMYITR